MMNRKHLAQGVVQNKGSKRFSLTLPVYSPFYLFLFQFLSSFWLFSIQSFECEDGEIVSFGSIFTYMISFDPHNTNKRKAE